MIPISEKNIEALIRAVCDINAEYDLYIEAEQKMADERMEEEKRGKPTIRTEGIDNG
jgi:hypothetical protein